MFSGSLVAIVTPMRPDGAVDFDAWGRLLEFHAQAGTNGIVVGGTTGESPTLSDAELGELTQRACALARGRMAVLAGAGTSSTAATVARVRWLSGLPLDALLVVTPAYNRPSQEGLYQHFAAAAAASAKPLVLYNVPTRTAVDLQPATVARLSRVARIGAIKEAVPEVARVRELLAACAPGFVVLSGDDASAREVIHAGARGVISVTANVAPAAMSQMVAAALAGDRERAQALDAPLAGLHRDLFLEANPIPVKWLLVQMGLTGAGIRLPLTPLAEEYRAAVLSAARRAGILG
jgi:4-hydroxy-tetrahydrodipicolinate synthase